jgi:hypothetical protein
MRRRRVNRPVASTPEMAQMKGSGLRWPPHDNSETSRMTSAKPWLGRTALAICILALTASVGSAAVTIVNRDARDHKLSVVEDNGAKSTEHVLQPSQVLEGVCEKGCVIRLNDSEEDEYELEAGDKVSIEEGYLYYEEQPGAQQGVGAATTPPPQAAPAAPAPAPAPAAPAPAAPKN